MFAESDFKVGSGSNYDAVRLPYANGQFNMTLLIPKGQNAIDAVLNEITGEGWSKLNDWNG